MKKILIIIVIVMIAIAGVQVIRELQKHTQTEKDANKKLQVNTSFYPMYFFASQIAKDRADIQNITPSGSEPHDYEPTAGQIAGIEKGDIMIMNGGVEAWGNNIKSTLKGTNVDIVVAGDKLLTKELVEEGKKQTDPHIWLAPKLAKKEAAAISKEFIKRDPSHAKTYEENVTILNKKLDELDAQYRKALATCKLRDIITSHAAFAYLAEEYNLKQVAIAGLSPDQEPSAKELADIADFAKQNNVHYIFFESMVSPKLSETIAHEVGAATLVLDPIEGISDDDIKAGKNYFTVMEDNLKNLTTALQCTQ